MRKALTNIYYVIVALIMFDVMILMTSIAQLAYEGQTGYWSPFWRIQAEFFINLIS